MLIPARGRTFYLDATYPDEEALVHWPSPDVEFRVGHTDVPGFDDPTPLDEAIRAAFQAWEDVECASIDFTEGEPIEDPTDWQHPEGHYILVYFIVDPTLAEDAFAIAGVDELAVAKRWLVYDAEAEGTPLVAATLYLNGYSYEWSTSEGNDGPGGAGEEGKLDVQSVVTAMIGRSLGITSRVDGATTQQGGWATNNTDRRSLEQDDIDAISYLYPTGCCELVQPEGICQAGADCVPPEGGGDADAGPDCDSADAGAGGDGDADVDVDGGGDADAGGGGDADGDLDVDADAGAEPRSGGDGGGCCSAAPGVGTAPALSLAAAAVLVLTLVRRRRR
ncbi:MAG: hypothetical protein HYY06_16670 [Deltaproteobacteria bacterium]|nr:hypothetical protein [Deltaproteobacteria bacterium]